MKFFALFFILAEFSGALYISLHFIRAMKGRKILRIMTVFTVFFLSSCFMAGRFAGRFFPAAGRLFESAGSLWLPFLLYFTLGFLILDLITAAARICRVNVFTFNKMQPDRNYKWAVLLTVFLVCAVTGAGAVNARFPVLIHQKVSVDRKAGSLKKLKAVLVSDIHMGSSVGRPFLEKTVKLINSQEPDVVLLCGDIFDGDPLPVIREDGCFPLTELRSRFGTYAVPGNHEYYSRNVQAASDYLESRNVKMLADDSVLISRSFYIAGRKDLVCTKLFQEQRKSVKELCEEMDRKYPVIIMDHQPAEIQEAAEAGVDLMVSGHTHFGQLWPLNYIVSLVWPLPRGFRKIMDSNFYVTAGAGTWGPAVRTSCRPEITVLDIEFGTGKDF